ncbi:hypothetical protein ACOMHN_012154 [Nucella lapillus]
MDPAPSVQCRGSREDGIREALCGSGRRPHDSSRLSGVSSAVSKPFHGCSRGSTVPDIAVQPAVLWCSPAPRSVVLTGTAFCGAHRHRVLWCSLTPRSSRVANLRYWR